MEIATWNVKVSLLHSSETSSCLFLKNVKIRNCLTCHAKSWLIGKDSDAGKDRGTEEKGMTEDEMDGWHHGLDESESE